MVYFKSLSPQVSQATSDPCGVCMDTINKLTSTTKHFANLTFLVTACGHLFCKDCIDASVAAWSRCPACRHPLAASDYYIVQAFLLILMKMQRCQMTAKKPK